MCVRSKTHMHEKPLLMSEDTKLIQEQVGILSFLFFNPEHPNYLLTHGNCNTSLRFIYLFQRQTERERERGK